MRLIDADALVESLGVEDEDIYCKYTIEEAPTIEAKEVVHGEWMEIRNPYGELEGWIHDECGREVKRMENFCPNCGARMDGKEKLC